MKKRLKDFLAGVGSVLEINPDVKIKFGPTREDSATTDLEKIGADFQAIGDDMRRTYEVISEQHKDGRYHLHIKITGKIKEDFDHLERLMRISALIKDFRVNPDPASVGPDGKIQWNDHTSDKLKAQ